MDKFVNLHVHTSVGSLLDGLNKIPDLFDKTLKLGQPACCITDHGTMYAMVDAAQYAQKVGQKFIPGCECYTVNHALIKDKNEKSSETDVSRNHLVLLAKNNDGYKRLMKICSWGMTEGFYYRPRIDDSVLEKYGTDGIIACSACIAGVVAQLLLHDRYEEAKAKAEYYAKLFKDGFYLEIQPVYDDEARQVKVNKGLIELAKETGIPTVCTTDAHYLNPEDAEVHEMLLCLQAKTTWDNPDRWKFPGKSFFIMSENEILDYMNKNGHEVLDRKDVEEAVHNTVDVAEQCNVSFTFGQHDLPYINPPSEEEEPKLIPAFNKFEAKRKAKENKLDPAAEYMRFLCIHGPQGLIQKGKYTPEYIERLKYEINVIEHMGFPSYFLIVTEIMDFCRKQHIAVGSARGSGGGSLVNYALGITKIDPLQHNLIFERWFKKRSLNRINCWKTV